MRLIKKYQNGDFMKCQKISVFSFVIACFCFFISLKGPNHKTKSSRSGFDNVQNKPITTQTLLQVKQSKRISSSMGALPEEQKTDGQIKAKERLDQKQKEKKSTIEATTQAQKIDQVTSQARQDLVKLFKENDDLKAISPEIFVDFAKGFGSEKTEEGQILLDKAFSRTPVGIAADKKIREAKKRFDKAQAIKIDEDLSIEQKVVEQQNKLYLLTNMENSLLAAIEQRTTEKEKVLANFRENFSKVENKDLIFSDPDKTKRLDALLKEVVADRKPKLLLTEPKGQATIENRRRTQQDYSDIDKISAQNDRLKQLQDSKPVLEVSVIKWQSSVEKLEEQRAILDLELKNLNNRKNELELTLADAEYEIIAPRDPKINFQSIINKTKAEIKTINVQISEKIRQANEIKKQLGTTSKSLIRDKENLKKTKKEISRVGDQIKKTQVKTTPSPEFEGRKGVIKLIEDEMARLKTTIDEKKRLELEKLDQQTLSPSQVEMMAMELKQ